MSESRVAAEARAKGIEPQRVIPEQARKMAHEWLDEALDRYEFGSEGEAKSIGWNGTGRSGTIDLRLYEGRPLL